MFKNKTENNVKEFPKELSQVILDGQKHGVGDELMIKGMVSVGNLMGRFVTPDSPEEALMKEMEERGRQKDVTIFFLEVRESNDAARRLYEKMGYEQIGVRKNFYEKPAENAIIMSKGWRTA